MPRQKASTAKNTPRVASLKHKDKRANIPTEELRDFVAEEEMRRKTLLYPRDASLDAQLVWEGKDEQDREDLAVPAVPIYIQGKIHPQAIIVNVRALPSPASGGRGGDVVGLGVTKSPSSPISTAARWNSGRRLTLTTTRPR